MLTNTSSESSANCGEILFKSFQREIRSAECNGSAGKNAYLTRLQESMYNNEFMQFSKLCLNQCLLRWFKPNLNLVSHFRPKG